MDSSVRERESERREIPEKRVTWAEAYFDLVFVFAITQVSNLLYDHHGGGGLLRALVVFIPVYWCWVGTTVQANVRDVDSARDRVGIFAVGLCGLLMALALPQAYGTRGVLFGAAYWGARLVLLGLILRLRGGVWRGPFGIGAAISGPLLLTGGLLHGDARLGLWAAGALIDLAGPTLLRSRLARVTYHPGHLPERFGLLMLVALGESIVSTGAPAAAATDLTSGELLAVVAAFTISCGLWWSYFAHANEAMRHAVTVAPARRDLVRRVFSYAHLVLVAAVITIAVGFHMTVAHPGERLDLGTLTLLHGGCALYLLTFGYTRWVMFRVLAHTRLVAAAVVLLLVPAMAVLRLPALAVLSTLAVLLVLLTAVEEARIRRARAAVAAAPAPRPAAE
ncbi:low temperature requirement protein A [Kitasatospora viridis]|uniref:Low temperature requirement protein LtrA n=1 Tax=Kitasatospora viridis TaxID=281105 RepID=A0A561UKE0_9ACTN|nr:low temperature requirement protein A [Kitasatospora viridis]TWF99837.1 low temperature requirement protein LtrA [Kitasatospora viridis]